MRLLYCYIRFLDAAGNNILYHGQKSVELNLSTKHRYTFYPEKSMLIREERKAPLPDGFWAGTDAAQEHQNIYNVNVVAGQNGSGKTTAIRSVMNMLEFFHTAAVHDEKTISNLLREEYNQYLLLFEENSKYYLLDYIPTKMYEPVRMVGFSNNAPLSYSCTNWNQLFIDKEKISEAIRSFLLKTKVIYMTNTLNQYDYERNTEGQNDHIRDSFIFDVSIGGTIGHDVEQFFLYEIYKQVKYVFDKNQADLRKKIEAQIKKKIIGYKIPDSLKIRMRLEHYQNYFANKQYLFSELDNTSSDIVEKLGLLCVGAFAENLHMRAKGKDFSIISLQSKEEMKKRQLTQEDLYKYIMDIECQYYVVVSCIIHQVNDKPALYLEALPDGQVLIGSENGIYTIWNPKTGRSVLLKNHGKIQCATYYSENRIIGSSGNDYILIWDAITGTILSEFRTDIRDIVRIVISPDRTRIIYVSSRGEMGMLDDATGKIKKYWHNPKSTGDITGITVASDNRIYFKYVSGRHEVYEDIGLYEYDDKQGVRRIDIGVSPGMIKCIAALSEKRIVMGSYNGYLYILSTAEKTSSIMEKKHNGRVMCIAVSMDGTYFVSGSDNGEIYIWDSKTCKCIYIIKASDKSIEDVVILPDGRICSCDENTVYTIWDIPGSMRLKEKQKQLLETIEKDECNKSKSTIKHEKETEELMPGMDFVHILTENCLRYIKYVYYKKESFFGLFQKHGVDTYEIQLNEKKTDEFTQDMIQFMQKYRYTCEPAYTIDFDWGLSSGEENMLRIFSDLYHIFDRDYSSGKFGDYKIYNNEKSQHDQGKKIECDTVLLFMDEADLTLHPEWQRCLIDTLINYIPYVYPAPCVKDIQLILTTHSPLLLGDIPSENITYLYCKKESEQRTEDVNPDACKPGETFGQNIHTILRDSFFLSEGTVGAFAAKKINYAAERMVEIKEEVSNADADITSLKNEMRGIQEIINVVAPGVLRRKLESIYREVMDTLEGKNNAQHRKAQRVLKTLRELTPEDQQYVLDAIYQEKSEND